MNFKLKRGEVKSSGTHLFEAYRHIQTQTQTRILKHNEGSRNIVNRSRTLEPTSAHTIMPQKESKIALTIHPAKSPPACHSLTHFHLITYHNRAAETVLSPAHYANHLSPLTIPLHPTLTNLNSKNRVPPSYLSTLAATPCYR
jgi:hypothetical protein